MVTGRGDAGHRPFGGYRISTEGMPDGRLIHYYEWPDAPEGTVPQGSSERARGAPAGAEEPRARKADDDE